MSISDIHSWSTALAVSFPQELSHTRSSQLVLLAWIYGFMGFSSLVTLLHPRFSRPESIRTRQAVNGWWPSALVAGAAAVGGPILAVPLFGILSGWTLHEYLRMLPREGQDDRIDLLAFGAIPLHYAALVTGNERLFFGGILFWTFAVLPLATASLRGPDAMLTRLPRIQLGLMLTVLALSHVPRLFFMRELSSSETSGLGAFLLLSVMFSDAWQFFCGKLLGRHPLAPVLSPKKTWEGLIGGAIIVSGIAAAATPLVAPWSRTVGAALGLALCVTGLLGDLLVSALKRGAGIKDTGSVLPGQGGVLDRCDSLLLSAPLYVYGISAWLG